MFSCISIFVPAILLARNSILIPILFLLNPSLLLSPTEKPYQSPSLALVPFDLYLLLFTFLFLPTNDQLLEAREYLISLHVFPYWPFI